MHIEIKKGLDIPIEGAPTGQIQNLVSSGQSAAEAKPKQISLNLWPFEYVKFKLLKKVGDEVKIGEPICEGKKVPGRMFVSPAGGVIKEVRRGLKRRLLDIVIEVSDDEQIVTHEPLDVESASREKLIERLMLGGVFSKIRRRPFHVMADPHKAPDAIFIRAIESAPFRPPAEMQVEGREEDFQIGLDTLKKITEGAVHLVIGKDSTCKAFTEAKNISLHTAKGPHPIGTHPVHIEKIDPIKKPEENKWVLDVHTVVVIGKLVSKGIYETERVISIAGPGIVEGQTGYFRVREGIPISTLVAGRIPKKPIRFISGDPLMGHKVEMEDFLGFDHFVFAAIPEPTRREFMHFFRLGLNKYSFSRAYYSGHVDPKKRTYPFTTSLHGEPRAFIDPALYDEIQALSIPTMQLVKAVMAEDYELAEELGLLTVAPEDFALTTFVDPSKMEMTEIMKEGIYAHSLEMLD